MTVTCCGLWARSGSLLEVHVQPVESLQCVLLFKFQNSKSLQVLTDMSLFSSGLCPSFAAKAHATCGKGRAEAKPIRCLLLQWPGCGFANLAGSHCLEAPAYRNAGDMPKVVIRDLGWWNSQLQEYRRPEVASNVPRRLGSWTSHVATACFSRFFAGTKAVAQLAGKLEGETARTAPAEVRMV